ncbi:MAG: hypothetical protein CMN34_07705 [Saprospirales bacterium]|nr:hypothetical protein [Saprospirales bacterium]|tara:strand:+ start:7505 stop:8080 length:576 start_codon:yes stop_codon:yes gene_type:complete
MRLLMLSIVSCLWVTSYAQIWELQKNEGGIKVWTRPSGRSMDDSKVTALIKADMDDVVEALMDPLTYPKWQPKAAKVTILSESSSKTKYHMIVNTPVVADRDVIVEISQKKTSDGYTLPMTSDPDAIDKREGIVRILIYDGEYRLIQKSNGVEVTLEYSTDPGGNVPSWLLGNAATKEPFEIFKGLKSYLE